MEKFKKIVPFIASALLFGAGIFMYFRGTTLTRTCTESVTATVVNMREDFTSDVDTDGIRYLYYPIIEYSVSGETLRGELGSGSNPPAYSVNDKIDILYNPDNPSEFIVAGENQNLPWIILVSLGAVFLVAGIFLIFRQNR